MKFFYLVDETKKTDIHYLFQIELSGKIDPDGRHEVKIIKIIHCEGFYKYEPGEIIHIKNALNEKELLREIFKNG